MTIRYRIHPAIGIARVGDSPDDFFVGPEAPGVLPAPKKPDDTSTQPGKYKDSKHRIKRQGARFRVYEYTEDSAGAVTKVREVTAAEAQIEWEVHLANRKAAAPKFTAAGRRNAGQPESDLIIDAGPQRVSGAGQAMKPLRGKFMKLDVKLGDLLTDSAGRLILLGGHGKSQSSPANSPLKNFADNNGWCDDTSDGPVQATVKLNGSTETIAADAAWVVVAPPDFAPSLENVVTLYDTVYNVMTRFDPKLAVTGTTKVSFTRDIYPILRRVSHLPWVSQVAAGFHGEGRPGHFIARVKDLSGKKPTSSPTPKQILQALRKPPRGEGPPPDGKMPKLPDLAVSKAASTTITDVQYKRMEVWANGQFEADWPGAEPAPAPFEKLPEAERPQALDRAALEACVGGPFFPGIEASRVLLEDATYDKGRLFRISVKLPPGALTAQMAVPWQADFNDCSIEEGADWWPGQRPNEVQRGTEPHAKWTPDWEHKDMVESWAQLGFVVEKKTAGKVEYVEDERSLKPPPPSS